MKDYNYIEKPTKPEKPKRHRSPHDKGRSVWQRHRRHFLEGKADHRGMYMCARCGNYTANPDVDHIIKRSVRPDLKYEPSNFQILCRPCHIKKDGGMR